MPDQKDTALGNLAVERGYVTQEQLDEALDHQRKIHDEFGMDQPLEQVLVGKHLLSQDQAQELRHAAAIQTGEARLVAGYEVISKLGQGGMGAVYKAKHRTSGQFVALKILPPSLATDELVKRFRREAEVVRKLDHENIVACTEFGFDKRRKVHFCALELVEGEDLAKRITRLGRLTEDEALSITNQTAMALQHAFFNGLVHRDVKPENIMVTADGTAKLLDLGLARPANQEATRLTESGMFVGSPYYASPEQALGEREIDTRADIYSLGATLYHMVTGKPPFEGTTALAILQKHVNEKLPWPAEVNPDLSDGLCMIIAKMMEKSPEDRYQTPNDLNRDLDLLIEGHEPDVEDAALKNSSVKVPAVRPGRRGRPASRERMARERERAAPRRAPSRRRDSARARRRGAEGEAGRKVSGWAALPAGAKIAAGAGALGLVIVVGLVMFLGGREPDRRPPKRGSSRDTLQKQRRKVPPEPVPPGADRPSDEARKVSPAVGTAADVGKAGPPPTLTLDLGGGVTMEFVYVKPGVFTMGGTEDVEPNHRWWGVQKPRHEVAITQGFYMGKYEVTQAQYEAVMGKNLSSSRGVNKPVEQVAWHEAVKFCRLATERTRKQFRLPTEAEWEYACRAGSTGKYCFGNDETGLGEYAWYSSNSGGQTHPVGQKKPNAWGLYDMHGNVWEWVADWYAADYYANSPRENPAGPDRGRRRLVRGGPWLDGADHSRSAFRQKSLPSTRTTVLGFRAVVSSPPGPRSAGRPLNVPDDAVEFGGHWYKLYEQKMTWHEAKRFCEKQGGHLGTITSKQENAFVDGLVKKAGGDVWIGLTDEKDEGEWRWVTGEDAVYFNWEAFQPDDRRGQDCVVHRLSHAWDDRPATHAGAVALICEWEPGWRPSAMPRTAKPPASAKPYPNEPDSLRVGLVGHWTFDEGKGTTARDSSGKGNDGGIKGGAKWVKGKIGGALGFDGTDDHVDVCDGPFDLTESLSMCVWIRPERARATGLVLAKAEGSGYGLGVRHDGRIRADLHDGRRYMTAQADAASGLGQWCHAVAAWDGEWLRLYVNGVLQNQVTPFVGRISRNDYPLTIGANPGRRTTEFFGGLIDDVRVYNRALSAEEIRLLTHPEEWVDARAGRAASRPSRGLPPTEKPTALLVMGLGRQVGDDAVAARLRASGWTVVERTDKQVAEADAVGKSLILISSTCGSHNIAAQFTNVPVPLIVWEAWCLDDLGMTGGTRGEDYDYDEKMTAVVISSRGHPLAAGLDGEITIYAKPGGMAWGVPGKNAIIAATLPGRPTRAALFAYEAGARMPGLIAPARRLSMFLFDTEASTLTEHGRRLFDAAVKWASGTDERQGRQSTHRPAMQEQALLAEFDRLVQRRDHAAARAHAETEAARPANAANADALRAAARVAKALANRPAAVRRGAESLVGKEVELRLKTGTAVSLTTGKIEEVTDDNLVVATTYMINRQPRERLHKVAWSALHPEQEDDFAEKGGWKVEPPERAVARAYAALASGDVDAAESAMRETGGHPLAGHLKARAAKARAEAAYTAAMARAKARTRIRNWKGAVEALEEALAARPDDAEAAKLLAEAERHIGPPPTLTLDLGGGVTVEFVYIKPGVFMMGDEAGRDDEKPVHEVAITQGFYIGKYEVTQAQYEAVVGRNPSRWKEPNRPVEQVRWRRAVDFCRLATERTGRKVRLLTEAEWEYGCRAGSTGKWCFGNDKTELGDYAWYKHNSGGQTHPVGQKKPNVWGLHDVHGNVREWVADWYDANYYAGSPRKNPTGSPTGGRRLLRGGWWCSDGNDCRSARRSHFAPSAGGDVHVDSGWGLRVAVSASPDVVALAREQVSRLDAAYEKAMTRAKMRIRLGNWKGAAEACEEALKAKPGDPDAKKLLAETESHIGPAPARSSP